MEIAGGAMLGYCAIGSVVMASAPASMITMAITQAKMGRSMKKLTTCAPPIGLRRCGRLTAAAGVLFGVAPPADTSCGFTWRRAWRTAAPRRSRDRRP